MERKPSSVRSTIAACVAAGILAVTAVSLAAPTPAAAEGFFESLFNGIRRAVSAPPRPQSDPFTSLIDHINRPPDHVVETASGPSKAFCVRTCDGHFFPVRAHQGLSAGEACRSFCPASETRLYSGSNIDYAMAPDGSRYADLPNAFVYRKQLVSGCTCNGRTSFGLAHIDATRDPTLRPGDVVVTDNAILAYTGPNADRTAAFTPVEGFRGLTAAERARLADTKIMQTPGATDVTASIPQPGKARSARLDR